MSDASRQYANTILDFIRPDYERTCASSMAASGLVVRVSEGGFICLHNYTVFGVVFVSVGLCATHASRVSTSTPFLTSSGPTTRGPAPPPCQPVSLYVHVSVSLALSSPVHVFVCDASRQNVYTILSFIRPDCERTCASAMAASESLGPWMVRRLLVSACIIVYGLRALCLSVYLFVCDTRLQYVNTIPDFIRLEYERTCASSMASSEPLCPWVSSLAMMPSASGRSEFGFALI